jgi:hypothetical protein
MQLMCFTTSEVTEMRVSNFATTMFKLFEINKRVGHTIITNNVLVKFLTTIDGINSLEPSAVSFNGVPLESWKMLAALKELILPSEVTMASNERERDLRIRLTDVDSSNFLTYVEFNDVAVMMKGALRRDNLEVVDVLSIRKPAVLGTVYHRAIVEREGKEFVFLNGTASLPLHIEGPKYFKEYLYSTPVEDIVEEFLRSLFMSLNA